MAFDSKGRFFYKGHPPTCRYKPFPCDIGNEAFYRKHPILDNPRDKRHYITIVLPIIIPTILMTRFYSKRWNKKARTERGVNTYFWGWKPPMEVMFF